MTMPDQPKSAIGNLADLEDGQIALSRYIVKRADGLFVTLSRLDSPVDFVDFVDRQQIAPQPLDDLLRLGEELLARPISSLHG